jgi:hypothetical protein
LLDIVCTFPPPVRGRISSTCHANWVDPHGGRAPDLFARRH